MVTPSRRCEACDRFADRDVPNYHHIYRADKLPRPRQSDGHIVIHGYAVEISGAIQRTWVFFHDIEPALAFGRAGRMSSVDIRGYGVFAAAREIRFDERLGDVITLHLTGENLDRKPDEAKALTRWLAGVTPESSHFAPPDRR
ncbi:hypothetical protein [Amycolatopsis sp. CA-128772]|uniref:hypothetical protein n=1 Tax=Amycolatopsis sp. CA-128772 TaxID=2073159 RepID=UPI000CD03D4B|nr:hypothetical protein [Amycolatopsis sp. CA-128772]